MVGGRTVFLSVFDKSLVSKLLDMDRMVNFSSSVNSSSAEFLTDWVGMPFIFFLGGLAGMPFTLLDSDFFMKLEFQEKNPLDSSAPATRLVWHNREIARVTQEIG